MGPSAVINVRRNWHVGLSIRRRWCGNSLVSPGRRLERPGRVCVRLIFFFANTWGSVFWVVTGELFPLNARAKCLLMMRLLTGFSTGRLLMPRYIW